MTNILIFSMIYALMLPRGLRRYGVVIFAIVAGVNSVVVGVN